MAMDFYSYETVGLLQKERNSPSRKSCCQNVCVCADLERYGDEKGACESIFSYGFLEDNAISAKVMFLDLEIPDDDPLRPAKVLVSAAAPGFRIFEMGDSIGWESDFIWLIIINEEDGLDFKIRQTTDGTREIQAFWNEQELSDTSKMREHLQEHAAWDVFQLRATVLLANRVEMQIETNRMAQNYTQQPSIRDVPWRLAERLRSLELVMLERTALLLDGQVRRLCFLYPATQIALFQPFPGTAHGFPSTSAEDRPCVPMRRSRGSKTRTMARPCVLTSR
jgi:hypothetical protein